MSPPDTGKRRSQAVRHLSIATTIIGVHILLFGVGGGIIATLARRHARPNKTHQDDTANP